MNNNQHSPKHSAESDDAVIQFAATWNGRLGLVQAVVGLATVNPAVIADAYHNWTDKEGHKGHASEVSAEKHANTVSRNMQRKRAGLYICAGALAVGGVAVAEGALRDQAPELQPIAITVEAASVALAGVTAAKFRARDARFKGQVHAERHNLVDLATSTVALAGVSATSLYPYADNAAALVVSAVSFTFGAMLYHDKIS